MKPRWAPTRSAQKLTPTPMWVGTACVTGATPAPLVVFRCVVTEAGAPSLADLNRSCSISAISAKAPHDARPEPPQTYRDHPSALPHLTPPHWSSCSLRLFPTTTPTIIPLPTKSLSRPMLDLLFWTVQQAENDPWALVRDGRELAEHQRPLRCPPEMRDTTSGAQGHGTTP